MHVPPAPLHAASENASPGWQVPGAGCYQAPRGRDFPAYAHQEWEWVHYRAGNILCQHGQDAFPTAPSLLWPTPPTLPRFCLDDAHGSLGRLCGDIVRELSAGWPDRRRMPDLLLDTEPGLIPEAVAERRGYHSASHLTREVRRHTSAPPGQWRRRSS